MNNSFSPSPELDAKALLKGAVLHEANRVHKKEIPLPHGWPEGWYAPDEHTPSGLRTGYIRKGDYVGRPLWDSHDE